MRRSSLLRRASRCLALCVALVPRAGRAEPPLPSIAWDAPAGCPDVDALTAEVARRLGGAGVPPHVDGVRARARQHGERWSVSVAIVEDGRTQERTLIVDSCAAAVRAAALVIAIAVDPTRSPIAEPEPEPAPEAEPLVPLPDVAPAPAGEPVVAAPAAKVEPVVAAPAATPRVEPVAERKPPAPRRPQRARGLVQLGPGSQAGMLPVDVGLATAVGLQTPRLRLLLGYTRWFAASVRRGAGAPYGVELSVHAATLRAGPVLRAGPLELPMRFGVELGALHSQGFGGDINLRRRSLWAVATFGLGVGWAPRALRGHGALIVEGEAAVALFRPWFVFGEDVRVFRVGPGAFRAFVMLEARFP